MNSANNKWILDHPLCHGSSFHAVPCPSAHCENVQPDLRVQKEIDTPLMRFCVDGQVTEADTIECRLIKTHMTTAEEIAHLQCCSLKLEKRLACHFPDYLNKIKEKCHVQYSGPVRAKQACIQYDGCNGMVLNYDLFYVPCVGRTG